LSPHQRPDLEPTAGAFDPSRYTPAPLQTEGLIRFTGSPDAVFAQIANHSAMTDWVPLLKTVRVSQPKPLPPGESMIGTTRLLTLRGGITVREEIVYWDPPHGYAYTTEGKYWPLRNYVGFMSVRGVAGGGDFVFREYFRIDGTVRRTLATPGVVIFGKRALGNLSKLIGGTSADFRHVPVKPADHGSKQT
jgi:Polyketide cyclase / dehydrase and lipid transport